MKRMLFIIQLFIVAIVFTNCGTSKNNSNQKKPPTLRATAPCSFVNETCRQVFEPNYIYDTSEMKNGINNFESHYFLNIGGVYKNLKSINYRICVKNLIALLSSIPIGSGQYDSAKHLSALRFTYGMNSYFKMVLILEPIYLMPRSKANSAVPDSADINSTGKYFYTDEKGNWDTIPSSSNMTILTDYYEKNIMILHDGDKSPSSFVPSKDTKSCIMTLQEINKVFCDGQGMHVPSDSINFQLVADTFPSIDKDFKLHIVAYYGVSFEKIRSLITFQGYAADFSELCPTNCNTVIGIKHN